MSKTTVLITGATGSLGASTLSHLLSDPNTTVVAIIRSLQKSSPFLGKKYASQVSSGQLSFTEIPDMTIPDVFDGPASQADVIMHIATPLAYDNLMEKLVKPSWQILRNILDAAEKSAGRVRRVIVTGTMLSTLRIPDDLFSGRTISEKDWNSITAEEAGSEPVHAYQYSKVYAEQNAWAFMEERDRAFDLVFLLAPSITGKSLQEDFKLERGRLGGQPGFYAALFDVEEPGFLFPHFADVDNVARIHVASLSPKILGNERYLFHAPELMSFNTIAPIIRERFPQLHDRVPAPVGDTDSDIPAGLVKTDLSKFEAVFGRWNWKSAEQSAIETVEDIVAYGDRSG